MREGLWTEVEPSQFPHEREALDFVRRRLPDREPWRAWSNFTFLDSTGRPSEVDLLVVAPRGIVLVEIKSYPDGELSGDARTWRWKRPGKDLRSYDNPFLAADAKAKRLKSLLLAQKPLRHAKLWVDAVVFLSSRQLSVSMDERIRPHVFGPDPAEGKEQANRLPGLIDWLTEHVADQRSRIDRPTSAAITRAMESADIRQSERYRHAGSWELLELLDEGETWQDYRARHKASPVEARARLHLKGRGVDDAERDSIIRAAEREYRLLRQLDHPGIDRPDELAPNPRGLALLHPYDPDAVRLDHWTQNHPDADLLTRLSLLRRIAEAVAHAHEHGLSHRALTPRHVWISDPDGTPTPKLRGWSTVARETTTSTNHTDGTRHPGHLLRFAGEDAAAYLAPELLTVANPSGRLADVFSLGCLAHLLIAGVPPAADGDTLRSLLDEHGWVPLSAAMDAAPAALVDVVAGATWADVGERFPSVTELLAWLDVAEEELTAPDEVDLLEATRGTQVAGWHILARLGAGGSSVVLLAERDGVTEVLKVARDADHAERLRAEHDVLARLRHQTIIAAHGREDIGVRTVLRLQPGLTRRVGEALVADTLAERLRADGPPTLDLLQRWGADLLDALVELEREGVDHRDLKPENLVFVERGQYKERHLAVIDFSLTKAPKTDLHAGTVGYLDPFLPDRKQPRWDLYAERYAAGMVLAELATGEQPTWGDGADPRSTGLDVPEVHADHIDPSIRDRLVALLHRLLHRDVTQRFDTADDVRRAWERVFSAVDPTTGHATGASADEVDLTGLTPSTPISELGLAPRLAGAVDRLGAGDVGTLARAPLNQALSGVGAAVRTELRHLVRRLREAGLAEEPEELGELDEADLARLSVDRLAERLVPARSNLSTEQRRTLEVLLGLDPAAEQSWPTLAGTAEVTGLDAAEVAKELDRARKRWAEYRPELVGLREGLAEWLAGRGGVATGGEIAEVLLNRRGSVAEDPQRSRRARAVVRACVEAEAWISQPRFRGVRVGERLLLALDRPAAFDGRGTIEWTADPLVEAAAALAERANDLVADGRVVPPPAAVSTLRDIDWPSLPDDRGFDDVRLVQLAAAASEHAAVSSRGELYPRGLAATEALRAGRLALLGRGGVSAEDVHRRVRARFPDAQPLPDRPELDRLLDEAGAGLRWVAEAGRYLLADAADAARTSTTWTAGTRYASVEEADADAADLDRRLDRLRRDGGFLAATVEPRRLDRAGRTLAARLDAPLLDLDAELIAAMRQAAEDAGARWEVLVDADAHPRTDPRFRALERLVGRAVETLDLRVRGAGRLVVAVDAGLLARYTRFDLVERWRDDLTRAAQQPDQPLRGLLLIVPGADREQPPTLDGTPVPVVTAGQWTRVPSTWLDRSAA
jgi:serine/threonine protein kinase